MYKEKKEDMKEGRQFYILLPRLGMIRLSKRREHFAGYIIKDIAIFLPLNLSLTLYSLLYSKFRKSGRYSSWHSSNIIDINKITTSNDNV